MTLRSRLCAAVATTALVSLAACSAPVPSSAPTAAGPAEDEITAARIAAHAQILSHDLFEGRAPATRGGELATTYLATQMALFGLEPGGDNGTFFQQVPIVESTVDRTFSSESLR